MMGEFTIYPAIDLRSGQVVRLKQGDPNAQKAYSSDPERVAETWISSGACWIHVVNLDGALSGDNQVNLDAVVRILNVCGDSVRVQLGGGIRALQTIEKFLNLGITRVILGTSAIENPGFARHAVKEFGMDQVVFGLDARDGILETCGWKKSSEQTLGTFATYLADIGAKTIIYTNICRDGMGSGVDWETGYLLAAETGLEVIASGGVSSLQDVKNVKAAGLGGVIIGRALYEKEITLQEALSC